MGSLFVVLAFIPGVVLASPHAIEVDMGNTNEESSDLLVAIEGWIYGSQFTASYNATPTSINVYYVNYEAGNEIRAAIVRVSDGVIMAYTENVSVSDSVLEWKEVTVDTVNYNLTAGVNYYIAVMSKLENFHYKYKSGTSCYKDVTWGVFDDPLTSLTGNSYNLSMYVTCDVYYDYLFNFEGVYDEDDGLYTGASNVTAYYTDGTDEETFEVDGTYQYGTSSTPYYFRFDLGPVYRYYWPSELEGYTTPATVYIFNASSNAQDYTFQFQDWLGVLDTYAWVKASRYVNGTLYIIDQKHIDATDKAVLGLGQNTTYIIELISSGGLTWTYGDVFTTTDTSISISITGANFPQDIILTYKYIRAYGYRTVTNSSYHTITLIYEDTQENTNYVNITIYDGNNTLVNSYNYEDTDSFSYTWSSAVANTSYYSAVSINHATYGTLIFRNSYAGSLSMTNPLDVSFLGTLPGGLDVSVLLPTILLVALCLMFSPLTAGIGGVVVVIFASLFTWFGYITIDINVLVFSATLTVLYAILKNYKRVSFT